SCFASVASSQVTARPPRGRGLRSLRRTCRRCRPSACERPASSGRHRMARPRRELVGLSRRTERQAWDRGSWRRSPATPALVCPLLLESFLQVLELLNNVIERTITVLVEERRPASQKVFGRQAHPPLPATLLQDVVLAREGALLCLGQAVAHDGRRRLVLVKLGPGPVAMVAVENLSALVHIDGHDDAALDDVSLCLELGRTHVRHELIFRAVPNVGSEILTLGLWAATGTTR